MSCTWTPQIGITLIVVYFMHSLDRTFIELESKIQEEQSLGEYSGPQVSSCKEASISFFLSQASHDVFH
jgi:hypothetical protein